MLYNLWEFAGTQGIEAFNLLKFLSSQLLSFPLTRETCEASAKTFFKGPCQPLYDIMKINIFFANALHPHHEGVCEKNVLCPKIGNEGISRVSLARPLI
jgi:hypothetical protein